MTNEQLEQFKKIPDWYENGNYKKKVYKLNDSQDVYVYYLRSDNVSTTDIEDASKDIEWGWQYSFPIKNLT